MTKTSFLVVALSVLGACKKESKPAVGEPATAPATATAPGLKDPDGYCKPFSDPSITKPPPADAVLGNGQTISLEYDGSKSQEGDSLFYELMYFNADGALLTESNGPFDGQTKGTFKTDKKVFESNANGRPGCMKVRIVQNAKVGSNGVAGTQVVLGTYPIKFEAAK